MRILLDNHMPCDVCHSYVALIALYLSTYRPAFLPRFGCARIYIIRYNKEQVNVNVIHIFVINAMSTVYESIALPNMMKSTIKRRH